VVKENRKEKDMGREKRAGENENAEEYRNRMISTS